MFSLFLNYIIIDTTLHNQHFPTAKLIFDSFWTNNHLCNNISVTLLVSPPGISRAAYYLQSVFTYGTIKQAQQIFAGVIRMTGYMAEMRKLVGHSSKKHRR